MTEEKSGFKKIVIYKGLCDFVWILLLMAIVVVSLFAVEYGYLSYDLFFIIDFIFLGLIIIGSNFTDNIVKKKFKV